MIKGLLSKLFTVSKTKWTWRWYVLRTPWVGIKIHWIRDEPDEWHNHPWNGISFFPGYYWEKRALDFGDGIPKPQGGWKRVWFVNFIGANQIHKTKGNILTLFIHGPRVNEDWFWGEDKAPWRGPQKETA